MDINCETASISGFNNCKSCGWPIVHVCCNGTFQNFKDAESYDYWMYCSNKSCKNHDGEGISQSYPEWCKITHK